MRAIRTSSSMRAWRKRTVGTTRRDRHRESGSSQQAPSNPSGTAPPRRLYIATVKNGIAKHSSQRSAKDLVRRTDIAAITNQGQAMSLPLERDAIQDLTEDLEIIIAAHLAWLRQLNRSLIYGGQVNQADLGEDAHLRSPFGQWYYGSEPHPLAEFTDFTALGATQQAMHAAARLILFDVMDHRRPAPELYD